MAANEILKDEGIKIYCIECPQRGSYVTVNGNCVTMPLKDKFGRSRDAKHRNEINYLFKPQKKCKYAIIPEYALDLSEMGCNL